MNRFQFSTHWIIGFFLLCGCAGGLARPSPSPQPAPLPSPTGTIAPSPSPAPSATLTPADTPVPLALFCSPLEGFERAQLLAAVSNPYHPPPPGSDMPHAGLDLADTAPGSQLARTGRSVRAFMAGRAAAVIHDRFPFGNALIVETSLQGLALPDGLSLPGMAPTPAAIQSLTCPAPSGAWDFSAPRSLYILYAHLQAAPAFTSGDALACGQPIGQVGMSGNAINPHLHFETRLGPPGLTFASLAHYDVSATPAEMAAYCDWSVRGVFQLVDPLLWLNQLK